MSKTLKWHWEEEHKKSNLHNECGTIGKSYSIICLLLKILKCIMQMMWLWDIQIDYLTSRTKIIELKITVTK